MASTTPRQATDVAHSATPLHARVTQTATTPVPVHPFRALARTLGSLQLALGAGFVFTVSMIVGTCLESWYSASIAQELIYYSWWFITLLGLLGCCIFFAAVKKWPWKKHQTGFLITHVGLLTMLAGGVLNTFLGTDATMMLIDNKAMAERSGMRQRSDTAFMTHDQVLILERSIPDKDGGTKDDQKIVPVSPGPLPWGSELGDQIEVPGLVTVLAKLANPLPRSVDKMIYPDVRLEVLAHLPHTRIEPVEAAKEKEFGFPAVKLELTSKDAGHSKAEWLSLTTESRLGLTHILSNDQAGMYVEFLGKVHPSLVEEFLKPPSEGERGAKGQLVFWHQGKKHRIDVAKEMGKTVSLGDGGWKVSLESYSPRPNSKDENEQPVLPVVRCKVIAPDGKATKYMVSGCQVEFPGPLDHLDSPMDELPEGLPAVWYHAPDVRYGYDGKAPMAPHVKTMMQFVQSSDKKLYYRTLLEQEGKMVLEDGAEAPSEGISRKIWERQVGSFLIEEYLPHAKPCSQRVIPVTKRPGLVSEENPAALLCRLTLNVKDSNGAIKTISKERWVALGRTARFDLSGMVGGERVSEPMQLTYYYKTMQLGFDIELSRAEAQVDPGTNRPATYTSFVKLYDRDMNLFGKDFMITMNEPLDHRGYKVYQSQFENVGSDPMSKKPIARSGFTIGRDPGLWLKYLGTAMLGLGIATMYYMKAYFFTGKARPAAKVAVK